MMFLFKSLSIHRYYSPLVNFNIWINNNNTDLAQINISSYSRNFIMKSKNKLRSVKSDCPPQNKKKQRKDDALRISQSFANRLEASKPQENIIDLTLSSSHQKPLSPIGSSICTNNSNSFNNKSEFPATLFNKTFGSKSPFKKRVENYSGHVQDCSFHTLKNDDLENSKHISEKKGQNLDEITIDLDSDVDYIDTTNKFLDRINFKDSLYLNNFFSKKKLLLVSDLNGVLVYRAKKMPFLRPHIRDFLDFIFENFHVAVWSSARPRNVNLIVKLAFKEYTKHLLIVWSRDQCDLEGHYDSRCESVKDLTNLWKRLKHTSESFGYTFDASNTVVIDDSPTKLKRQPNNQILVKEYAQKDPEDIELKKLTSYLKLLVAEYSNDSEPETYDVREFLSNVKYSDFQPDLGSSTVLEPTLQSQDNI